MPEQGGASVDKTLAVQASARTWVRIPRSHVKLKLGTAICICSCSVHMVRRGGGKGGRPEEASGSSLGT